MDVTYSLVYVTNARIGCPRGFFGVEGVPDYNFHILSFTLHEMKFWRFLNIGELEQERVKAGGYIEREKTVCILLFPNNGYTNGFLT